MTKQKSKTGYLLEFDCALRVSEIEHRARTAVTLVEMIIVVAVIALLAAMVVVAARSIDNQAKEKGAEGLFSVLGGALEEYYDFTGTFPPQAGTNPSENSQELYRELRLIPDSRRILEKINDSLIKNEYGAADSPPEIYDPWGTALDYQYDADGDSFPKLISAGPDRVFGKADDITNR